MMLPMLYMLIACAGQIAMIVFLTRGRSALPGKRVLIWAIMAEAAMNGLYALLFSAPVPVFAYIRWLILPAMGMGILLLHYLPAEFAGERIARMVKRNVLIAGAIYLTSTVYYVYWSLTGTEVYITSAGYAQFEAGIADRLVGVILLLYTLAFGLTGLIMAVRAERDYQPLIVFTTILLVAAFQVPAAANIGFRSGGLTFENYCLVRMGGSLVKFLPLAVIYVYHARRTAGPGVN